MLRQFYLVGEEVKRSTEWLIKRIIKVGAKVAYHGRRCISMWRRRLRCRDITAQCSRDEHGCDKWLTESLGLRYVQKHDKGASSAT
jgi:hypothetical protein